MCNAFTVTIARIDEQLCFALHAASRAMTGAYREPLRRLELTYPQYLVLLLLWEQDEQTITELGDRLRLDSGTLSPLVRRLEVRGLVERVASTVDERRVHVRLSADGHRLGPDIAEVQRCVLDDLQLGPAEAAELRRLARTVAGLPT